MIDICAQDLSDTIFRHYDMPFDFRKSIMNSIVEQDENCEAKASAQLPMNNEDKLDKLLKDLDFIDQPLAPKRLRTKKNEKCLKLLTITNQNSSSNEHSASTNDSDEEKRRRKNKDQVKIL